MRRADLAVREQYFTTCDNWSLRLRRAFSPLRFDPSLAPLLIVPGYGMNSFIFSFHPRGTSMERYLAEAGFEVWSLDMRGQGESKPASGEAGPVSLASYAEVDLPAAIERALGATRSRSDAIHLVGCSLGGSIAYAALALSPRQPIAGVVTMGAPLRWVDVHPLVRLAFASPAIAGSFRLSGTRSLVRRALPLLLKKPALLAMYMNTSTIDLSTIGEMARTVEDPHPRVNRDIARWIRAGDLELRGINVTRALAEIDRPLLVVLSNRDGIVPEATALTAVEAWGGEVDVLRVGSDENWYAHANLFVADDAPQLVFDPMVAWLQRLHPARLH